MIKNNEEIVKLALLGFGNAGRAFAKLLLKKEKEIREIYGKIIKVTAISTNSRGCLIDDSGIDLSRAISDVEAFGKFADEDCLTNFDAMDVAEKADYDVLVEMTPLNIFTGQPAISHIEAAFNRKKDVITANKGPVAWKFAELRDRAASLGCKFFYETTVMDGTPVFNFVEKTLPMAQVTRVEGILNSTTNFILEEMAKGEEYESILKRGQEMGFIEADPAMDIEGYDAAAKITALLNVLMDADIKPDMVDRKGIEDISADDIKEAENRGNVIKLICRGQREADGRIKASVKPEEISQKELFASIDSTTSVVSITTDLMKTVMVVEHEPEIEQTAYGIFGDLIRTISE